MKEMLNRIQTIVNENLIADKRTHIEVEQIIQRLVQEFEKPTEAEQTANENPHMKPVK